MFAIFLQEVVAKVAHMSVEAFVLSGSHAVGPMPHNGQCARGPGAFLVGEFCKVASEG